MNFLKLFFPTICLLGIFGCKTADNAAAQDIPFKIFDSGSYGGITTESQHLVSDENICNQLSSELYKNVFPSPVLTFSPNKSYIFITFGQKQSGGLDYKVVKVASTGNKIQVFLESLTKNMKPGEMMVTPAIANPYIVIEIAKTQQKELELIKD